MTGGTYLSAVMSGLLAVMASAQTQALSRSQMAGTVTRVGSAPPQLSVRNDQKTDVSVIIPGSAAILRIPGGETDPRKGVRIGLPDVAAGDRVVVVGGPPSGSQEWVATAVFVMSSSEVARLQQKDREDWRKRGTTGIVTAVDRVARTLTMRGSQRTYTVQLSEKTVYLRYSNDSPRFADARSSSFDEILTGDQMQVLGDKTEDGAAIRAERVISGSFRQIAATIASINPQNGDVVVKDLATKKPLTIVVNSASTIKKLPDQVARSMAKKYGPGREPVSAGDVGQALDKLAALPISELKPGDAIVVCTTQGSIPGRVTVVMLLAGVEPLLTASSTAAKDILSGWTITGTDAGQ